jgi:hypothetical protein
MACKSRQPKSHQHIAAQHIAGTALSVRAEKFARLERWAGAFEHHPLQMA